MSNGPNYRRGLSAIPSYVKKSLDHATLNILRRDGHGLSFPDKSGCQMRFVRNGKDEGGFYSYALFGGVRKAIDAAMNRQLQLRVIDNKNAMPAIKDGVLWYERYDKRKDKTEYAYRVSYKKPDGRSAQKTFSFGHTRPSADKQLHGFRTATLFRHYFMIYGADSDFSLFGRWKQVRLYTHDQAPFDWHEG